MQVIGITGIVPEILAELKLGKPRTLEFVSAQNVVSAAAVPVGETVFISTVPQEDLTTGDAGILAIVLAASVAMQRVSSAIPGVYYEERERLSVRLQLKYSCVSHVRAVTQRGCCVVLRLDVLDCTCPRVR